ncbi:hypothetical protein HK102_013690 [Quaeritorhiza haematococci]|nr:hypothetical protein HK102_013690 [Quaeritorhiza haematococci]
MSSAPIPVVDFAPCLHPDASSEDCKRVAQSIHDACRGVGFFYLEGHGIPDEILDTVFNISEVLFALPLEEKLKYAITEANVGYSHLTQERLDPTRKANDCKEAFNFGKFTSGGMTKDQVPETFRSDEHWSRLQSFGKTCHTLCLNILRAFATCLSISPADGGTEYFAQRHDYDVPSGDILRLLKYPGEAEPVEERPEDGIRAGGHSDYGSLTLLFQKDIGGLQVLLPNQHTRTNATPNTDTPKTPDGTWVDVPPRKGAIVINTGDLIEFWTNGLFRSTVHRVVVPVGEQERSKTRYSIAYFCHPNNEVPLDPIPSPIVPTQPTQSQSHQQQQQEKDGERKRMTAHEHLMWRLRSTYTY